MRVSAYGFASTLHSAAAVATAHDVAGPAAAAVAAEVVALPVAAGVVVLVVAEIVVAAAAVAAAGCSEPVDSAAQPVAELLYLLVALATQTSELGQPLPVVKLAGLV